MIFLEKMADSPTIARGSNTPKRTSMIVHSALSMLTCRRLMAGCVLAMVRLGRTGEEGGGAG